MFEQFKSSRSLRRSHILLIRGDNTDSDGRIDAVQRMQDYITQHVNQPIALSALAHAAGYSNWHAARIFKEITGDTPFTYIRKLRLSQAALRLRNPGPNIVDVALDFVFESHEGFTRAFTKQFGLSPWQYRKSRPSVRLFMPPRARDYHLTKKEGGMAMSSNSSPHTVFVQVINRPARKLILKRAQRAKDYYEYCEELGCDDVWNALSGIKEALYEPIGMWLPENLRKPGTGVYAQGVEVGPDFAGKAPDGFEIIDLPPSKVMIFQGQPYDDEKFEEAIGELWEVMNTYNPQTYGYRWADEDGPRFQLAPMGYRGYIEGRPVREVNR